MASGTIRPLALDDIPAVAAMYRRRFLDPDHQGVHGRVIEQSFVDIFFHNPWYDPEIASSVYLDGTGQIIGFLGVTARPWTFRNRPVRGAVSAHFMTAPGNRNPLAGPQLLSHLFAGPQDFSLTDGANDLGRPLWEALGGLTVPAYSFHWRKVLRPTEFVVWSASRRNAALRILGRTAAPVALAADAIFSRLVPSHRALRSPRFPAASPEVTDLLVGTRSCSAPRALQPSYNEVSLTWLLNRASRITQTGSFECVGVPNGRGKLKGWYSYYAQPGGPGQVLQVVAPPDAFAAVFDHLCTHARRRGVVVITGRAEPAQLPVLASRHCSFVSGTPWFQAHSRDREILGAILSGDVFLTALEGEWCTSFRGV